MDEQKQELYTKEDMKIIAVLGAATGIAVSFFIFKKRNIVPIPMLHQGLVDYMNKHKQPFIFPTDKGEFALVQLDDARKFIEK